MYRRTVTGSDAKAPSLQDLPTEVLERILTRVLSLRHIVDRKSKRAVADLYAICRTCKALHSAFQVSIDFVFISDYMSIDSTRALMHRLGSGLSHLVILDTVSVRTATALRTLMEHRSSLTSFSLYCRASAEAFGLVSSFLKYIGKSLQSLKIDHLTESSSRQLIAATPQLSSLTCLILTNVSCLSGNDLLVLAKDLGSRLRKLCLVELAPLTDNCLEHIGQYCPFLTHLFLDGVGYVSTAGVCRLLAAAAVTPRRKENGGYTSVTSLHYRNGNEAFSSSQLNQAIGLCPNIQHININVSKNSCHSALNRIARTLSSICITSMGMFRNIPAADFTRTIVELQRLRRLEIEVSLLTPLFSGGAILDLFTMGDALNTLCKVLGPQLEAIAMHPEQKYDLETAIRAISRCVNLRELRFGGKNHSQQLDYIKAVIPNCVEVDEMFYYVGKNLKRFAWLLDILPDDPRERQHNHDVENANALTGVALAKMLQSHCENLEFVRVEGFSEEETNATDIVEAFSELKKTLPDVEVHFNSPRGCWMEQVALVGWRGDDYAMRMNEKDKELLKC